MIFRSIIFVLWLFVWLFLSWPAGLKHIILGLIVSAFVTFMTIDVLSPNGDKKNKKTFTERLFSAGWFIVYVFVFLWECLKANIDVAYRVISPSLPIKPGTLKVKTSLKSDIGLTFLSSSITLTPGTTTVDIDKDSGFIYIHWLYIKDGEKRTAVVQKFEHILRKIFE